MINGISSKPWDTAVKPTQMSPHVFYVGNQWVGIFVADSGDGLVLFDAGLASQYPIITSGITELGLDPLRIRKVLLSHAHYDHCGGMSKILDLTHAECYMADEDSPALNDRTALLTLGNEYEPFKPDFFYSPGQAVELGRFKIEPVVIGGHTPGTTCFFFDDCDEKGNIYKVGIHGGLGFVFLNDTDDPIGAIENYRKAQDFVYNRHVDIALSFHPYNLSLLERAGEGGWKALIDDSCWKAMIDERLGKINEIEKEFK